MECNGILIDQAVVDKFGIDTSDIINEIAKDTEKQRYLEDAVHLYGLAKVQMYLRIVVTV